MFKNKLTLLFRAVRSFKFYGTTTANTMTSIVRVNEGKLQGSVETLFDGSPYYSFKGIRYAQPPVGKLRFKAPLPPQPWEGVYEAIKHGSVCPQYDITTMQILEGNEDCLFLNIYTKSLQSGVKAPVMFYIHGGGFMSGSGDSDMLGPKYLLQHDVVLVTINYRLELLGFLCLNTPEVPGNAGLKDQVAALRWVKNNIAQFGGDPNNITIFGESAGGASVTYHMASPMSKGLFHKAISQSGVFLCSWAQGNNLKERAFKVGSLLGKNTNNADELLEFLQSIPVAELTKKITIKIMTKDERQTDLPIVFSPVVENKFDSVESFLCEEPIDLLISKKIATVPAIIGYNSFEGVVFAPEQNKKYDILNKSPVVFLPKEISNRASQEKNEEMGKQLKKFYAGDKDLTQNDVLPYCHIQSDVHFVYNIHRFVNLYSLFHKEIFMYSFNYDTELNLTKKLMGCSHLKGASHADDVFYMFSTLMTEDLYKEKDDIQKIVYKVTKLWTNFAKTGDPTPDERFGTKWDRYTPGSKEYLSIDETMAIGKFVDRERIEFWNKLYNETGLPCITKCNL